MKALSLRQPWAELILQGKKTIETRTWNTSFRGQFLIHAALQARPDHMHEFGFEEGALTRGAVVGSAELVSVIAYIDLRSFDKDRDRHCVRLKAWDKPMYGYVLKNVQRIKPIPCKGMLNFFPVPDRIVKNL